jgi:hypothetical protein
MKTFTKLVRTSMLGLALISIGPSVSDARVKGPRLEGTSQLCGMIQDQLDQIVKAFKNAKTRAEADALRQQGHNLVQDWNRFNCSRDFGNWYRRAAERNWNWHNPKSGTVVAPVPVVPSHRPTGRLPNSRIVK